MRYLLLRRTNFILKNSSNFIFLYRNFLSLKYFFFVFKNIYFFRINDFISLIFLKRFFYKIKTKLIVFCWLTNNTKNLKIFYYYNFVKLLLIKNTRSSSLKNFILKNSLSTTQKIKSNLKIFLKMILKRLSKKFVLFFLKLLSWSVLYYLKRFSKLIYFYFFFKIYNNWGSTKNKIFRFIKRRTTKKIINFNKIN